MWIDLFFKGFVVGLLASIPLGPIGVLCVQRTINKRFSSGFASGLGAATADTTFATIALFFFSLAVPYIEKHLTLLKVVGGIIIFVIGLVIFLKKTSSQIRRNRNTKPNLLKDYISIFLLTITNPAYILVFFGLFAAFKVGEVDFTPGTHLLMILGVLAGAALWWFILTFSVSLFRKKFRARHIYYINKLAGLAILTLGAIAMVSAFF